jgi:dinuclear metal center YbgI/SA1388 family protein
MPTVADLENYLEQFAPARLAAEWDNLGLLIGDSTAQVERVMTCLTVTPESVAEAVERRASLMVTHHPFPFRAAKRFTADNVAGRMFLDLVKAGIAVYSPHTAFDSGAQGINQRLAEGLKLRDVVPLITDAEDAAIGTGRTGRADGVTLQALAQRCAAFLKIAGVQVVGRPEQRVNRVGIACGSGGELLDAARQAGCDCLVTGETRFHTCLEAQSAGVSLILTGHYASERFAVEALAAVLSEQFPQLECWPSQREADPLDWLLFPAG